MKIKYFCPRWGSNDLSFNEFIKKVKNAGYDGVEMSFPADIDQKDNLLRIISDEGLLFIAQHWETMSPDFKGHEREYRHRLENLALTRPVLINSQTGRDFFSFEQNEQLMMIASDISQRYGVKIVHETHRGRFGFAAHVAADYLKRLPELRIGFDVSHWCAVAESFLHDQVDAVSMAISRADHIHARVGFPGGPQVPDPRVFEWIKAVEIHVGWWKRIVERSRAEGKTLFTITPEFGPYPYMTILPQTQQPIANQWEVNVYMMNMLRSIFAEK